MVALAEQGIGADRADEEAERGDERGAAAAVHTHESAQHRVHLQQGVGCGVGEQLAGQPHFGEAPPGHLPGELLQRQQAAGIVGGAKQGQRCMQRAVRGAPAQGLIAEDAVIVGIDDGLIQGQQPPFANDAFQFRLKFCTDIVVVHGGFFSASFGWIVTVENECDSAMTVARAIVSLLIRR